MSSNAKHGALSIRVAKSSFRTPYPSSYSSIPLAKDEKEDKTINKTKTKTTFDFLRLPSELRNRIYELVFSAAPHVIDLDPDTFRTLHRHKLLALFAVSHQVYNEATHHFFSNRIIQLFPTYPGRYIKTKRPLLARLPARYRSLITTLELRLGPQWGCPPKGWVVNGQLGLADCIQVRLLRVHVECDPSDPIFNGYRKGDGFYERFSQDLLDDVLNAVPSIKIVEIDANPYVKRTGDMISGLVGVITRYGSLKKVGMRMARADWT